ncbi:MAG: thiol peroxidase [Brumimicrobium sp.]
MGTTITFKGNPLQTAGKLPEVGTKIKSFTLTDKELNEKTFEDFKGQNLVLNIFPSINTPVCAQSVRTFNEKAANLDNTKVLCISKDLPFAQAQFCGSEGIENVENLSDFRNNFGKDFGVEMIEGPLKGLHSRAVIVVNPEGQIVYTEQVPEIGQEPNYEAALGVIQ